MSEPITLPAPIFEVPIPARSKWDQEYQAFRRLLPQLLATYRGRYVAIHGGQVADSEDDKQPWPCGSWPRSATWRSMSA